MARSPRGTRTRSPGFMSFPLAIAPSGPPVNIAAPTITGAAQVGQPLFAYEGQWTGYPSLSLQWRANGAVIPGATGLTYTPVAADVGKIMTVTSTATNGSGVSTATSAPTAPVVAGRPRVFVTTDLGGSDKDDHHAMMHFLTYADRFRIEGIGLNNVDVGNTTPKGAAATLCLDAYEADYPTLSTFSADYPAPPALRSLVTQGALTRWADASTPGPATATSAAIIAAARSGGVSDPLYILNWGGEQDLARALYDAPDILPLIRVYTIAEQDPNSSAWLRAQMSQGARPLRTLWRILNKTSFRGVYMTPTSNVPTEPWSANNALGYGAMGNLLWEYTRRLGVTVVNGLKEGDAPSFLYVLDQVRRGVGPTAGGWGGKFQADTAVGDNYWVDSADSGDALQGYAGANTVYTYQSAFRADWIARFARMPRTAAVWISTVLPSTGALLTAEGNNGATAVTWTITRGGRTDVACSVSWAVAGTGANPVDASDFAGGVLPSGTVSFAAGETSKTVTVNVAGDTTVEPDEAYTLALSNAVNCAILYDAATYATARGISSGTVTNDDTGGGGGIPVTLAVVGDSMGDTGYKGTGGGGNATAANRTNPADVPSVAWPRKYADEVNAAGVYNVNLVRLSATGWSIQQHIDDFAVTGAALDAVPAGQPLQVVVYLGSNMDAGDGLLELYARTETLCGMILARRPDARLVLAGYPCQGGAQAAKSATYTIPHGQNLAATFSALRAQRFIDFASPPFNTPAAADNTTNFHSDKTHLIVQGHIVAKGIAKPVLDAGWASVVAPSYPVALRWASGTTPSIAADAAAGTVVGDLLGLYPGMSVTAWKSDSAAFTLTGRRVTRSGTGTIAAGTVNITVSGEHPTLGPKSYTMGLTVTAASSAPSVSIGAGQTVTEGDSGFLNMVFEVTRSGSDLSGTSSVDWAVAHVTTVAADLGTPLSGTVSFAAGETSKSIVVPIVGDTVYEGTETLKVALSNPVGCTIGTSEATGTILDNDPAPSGPTVLAFDTFSGMAAGDTLFGRAAPIGGAWRRPLLLRYPAVITTNAAPPVPVVSTGDGAVQVASTHWDQTPPNDGAWKPGEHILPLSSPSLDGYTECVFQLEDATDQAGVTIREVESDGTRLSIVVAVNAGNLRAEVRRLDAGAGAGTDPTSRKLYGVAVLGAAVYGTPVHLGVLASGAALKIFAGATELTPTGAQNGSSISGNTLTIPAQIVAGHPGIQQRNRARIHAFRRSDAFQSTPLAAM